MQNEEIMQDYDEITILEEYEDGGFDIHFPDLDWHVLSKIEIAKEHKIAELKIKDNKCMIYKDFYNFAKEICNKIEDYMDNIDNFEEIFSKYMYGYYKANEAREIFCCVVSDLAVCKNRIQLIIDEGEEKHKKYDIVIVDGIIVENIKKALICSENMFNIAYCMSSLVLSSNIYDINEMFEEMSKMISKITESICSAINAIDIEDDNPERHFKDANDIFHCYSLKEELNFEQSC